MTFKLCQVLLHKELHGPGILGAMGTDNIKFINKIVSACLIRHRREREMILFL
jgi:hypothetical protein